MEVNTLRLMNLIKNSFETYIKKHWNLFRKILVSEKVLVLASMIDPIDC